MERQSYGGVSVPVQQVAVPGWPAFPAVYGPRYWPQAGVWMQQNTLLNRAQTRALYETGWVPALANTNLPYSALARWLRDKNELKITVAKGGCYAIGIRQDAVWSPVFKKPVRWVIQGYVHPPHIKAQVDAICN